MYFSLSDVSFIPLFDSVDNAGDNKGEVIIPARKVAVSEILPLTLVGNQVLSSDLKWQDKKLQEFKDQ